MSANTVDRYGEWVSVYFLYMYVPESEDEKHQQHAECSDIVHGFYQHYKLSLQGR